MKSAANRDSAHFYGALNLQTGEETVLRSDVMNAEVSALFLNRVLLTYPDVPIVVFWDRAPWHGGEDIRSVLAANPRLELIRFPADSPELNLKEHVWKAAREAVSHNHCRTNLSELAKGCETHLKTTRFPCSLLDKHGHSQLYTKFK